MTRMKESKDAGNLVDYINDVSVRLKRNDEGHEAIEKKLQRCCEDGSELLNHSFDNAFGLNEEEKNKEE